MNDPDLKRDPSAKHPTAKPAARVDPRQLLAMTDDTGVFQHARLGLPDPHHGYCVDDNARALIAAVRLRDDDLASGGPTRETLVNRYLTFVTYAIDPATRRVRNFMGYDRRWLEPVGSHDSQARALWALGVAAAEAPMQYQRDLAGKAFQEALPGTQDLDSLRSWAFLILGLDAWLTTHDGQQDKEAAGRFTDLADRLTTSFEAYSDDDWPWWEPVVTYDNARLPQAMLVAQLRSGNDNYSAIGMKSLRWLLDIQTHPKTWHLSVIGNNGWFKRDTRAAGPARFDQQPLEAAGLIDACEAAYFVNADEEWVGRIRHCFAWYHGKNDLGASLIDPETGGCRDGLTPTAVNLNQGAESILAYLMSCQTLRALADDRRE